MTCPKLNPPDFSRKPSSWTSALAGTTLAVAGLQLPAAALEAPAPPDIRASMGAVQVGTQPARASIVAPAKSAAAKMQALPQITDQLPPATVVAPPKAAPARAEVARQLSDRLPKPTLVAPLPTAAEKLARTQQPLLPSRAALQAYRIAPGVQLEAQLAAQLGGSEPAMPGSTAPDCAPGDHARQGNPGNPGSQAECLLWSDDEQAWQRVTSVEADPVSGALLVPGVTLNPPRTALRSARYLEEITRYLASLSGAARAAGAVEKSPSAGVLPGASGGSGAAGGSGPGGSGGSSGSGVVSGLSGDGSSATINVNDNTVVNIEANGSSYNVLLVDLLRASGASYVNGLTLNGYSTVTLAAGPGGTLQLNNISLAGGTGSQGSTLVLQTSAGGTIALLGGSSTGTGGNTTARVVEVSVIQSGGAQVAEIGLNGTSGTTLNVAQSTTAPSVLKLDIQSSDLTVVVSQSGSAGQVATGIVLKAAPGSSFTLSQK